MGSFLSAAANLAKRFNGPWPKPAKEVITDAAFGFSCGAGFGYWVKKSVKK